MAGVTLDDMQSFDFSAPMNETVIYDDSDDDDKSTIPITYPEDFEDEDYDLQKSDNESCNVVNNETGPLIDGKMLEDSGELDNTEETRIKQERSDHSDDISTNDYRNDLSNEEATYNNYTHETKTVTSQSNLSKVEKKRDKKSKKKKKLLSKTDTNNVRSHLFTHISNQACEDNEQQIESQDSSSANANTEVNTISEHPLSLNIDESITNTETVNGMRKEDCEELSDYIKTLFDTLSENLILTIQAFRSHIDYISYYKTHEQCNLLVQTSRKQYFSLKNQYFQLSYSAVLSIILPQELKKDTKFTDQFLNNTLQYARQKMNLTFSKEDLEPFYYELVAWAKRTREVLLCKSRNSASYESVELKRQLNEATLLQKQLALPVRLPENTCLQRLLGEQVQRPPVIRATSNVQTTINSDVINSQQHVYPSLPKPPILPPYRDFNQTSILAQHQNSAAMPALPSYSSSMKRPLLPEYPNLRKMNQQTCNTPIFAGGAPNREVIISVEANTLRNCRRMPQNSHSSIMFPSADTGLHIQPQSTYHPSNISSANVPNSKESNLYKEYARIVGANIPAAATSTTNVYNNNTYQYQYQNTDSSHHHQHMNAKQPNGQQYLNHPLSSYRHQQYSAEYNNNHGQAVQLRDRNRQNEPLNQSVGSNRSSVSTDSGLASPLQFTGADGTVTSTEDGQLAPLITHVTSLNPKATQIAEGACHICGRRTKKKCLGCYRIYYCSTGCQVMDWTVHKDFCRHEQQIHSKTH